MEKLHIEREKVGRLIGKDGRNKKKIEQELGVRLKVSSSGIVTIQGDVQYAHYAVKVIQAFCFGFELGDALLLGDPECRFEVINIKNYAKSKNRLREVKGRLIGTQGRVKRVLEELGDVVLCVSENKLGIIGKTEEVVMVREAIDSLLKGAKQSRIYRWLEKGQRHFRRVEDVEDRGNEYREE
ncbi:MAG: KH domain-containing protein [Nanoarchaeota archaeon]